MLHVVGSSVLVPHDPAVRGSTAAAAADPQSSAAPSTVPPAESTHVTPGNVCFGGVLHPSSSSLNTIIWTTFPHQCLQQQIQEVFKNQQEQLNVQLLQQKNAGIVSQEVNLLNKATFYTYLMITTILYTVKTSSVALSVKGPTMFHLNYNNLSSVTHVKDVLASQGLWINRKNAF